MSQVCPPVLLGLHDSRSIVLMLLHARIRDFRLVAVVDAAGSVRTQVQALVLVRVDDLAALQLLAG